MKDLKRFKIIFVMLVVFYAAFPGMAYAYINPGTGTFILQLIIGALTGGIVAIKLYWNKIKAFFKNLFKANKNEK